MKVFLKHAGNAVFLGRSSWGRWGDARRGASYPWLGKPAWSWYNDLILAIHHSSYLKSFAQEAMFNTKASYTKACKRHWHKVQANSIKTSFYFKSQRLACKLLYAVSRLAPSVCVCCIQSASTFLHFMLWRMRCDVSGWSLVPFRATFTSFKGSSRAAIRTCFLSSLLRSPDCGRPGIQTHSTPRVALGEKIVGRFL